MELAIAIFLVIKFEPNCLNILLKISAWLYKNQVKLLGQLIKKFTDETYDNCLLSRLYCILYAYLEYLIKFNYTIDYKLCCIMRNTTQIISNLAISISQNLAFVISFGIVKLISQSILKDFLSILFGEIPPNDILQNITLKFMLKSFIKKCAICYILRCIFKPILTKSQLKSFFQSHLYTQGICESRIFSVESWQKMFVRHK